MPLKLSLARSACAVAALALAGCGGGRPAGPQGPPPVSVTTATVMRGDIATYATFDGQITPVYQTTLSTAEAGTIASVDVTEGDFVHAGQILASLDTSQLQASLKAGEATVRQDQAQLARSNVAAPVAAQQYSSAVASARQNLQAALNAVRTSRAALASDDLTQRADAELLQQAYVSRQTYEQARAAYVSTSETLRSNEQAVIAQQAAVRTALTNTDQRLEDQATIAQNAAGLDAARANVELLQAQIAQSSIVAPFDGQITQRFLDPGAFAGTSAGILELAQVSRVYVVANVPDIDLASVRRGAAVTFQTPSLPGRVFHGTVFDVNTTPTSGTLSYRVRLLQPNPDLALRGSMLVTVTAVRARHTGVLLVPTSALTRGPAGPAVFTLADGKLKRLPVRLGIQTETLAEVSGPGLAPNTPVITAPSGSLQDGSPVMLPGTNPPAAPGASPAGGR